MGAILGIDYGTKRMGVSLSDETETIASELRTLQVFSKDDALNKITKIVKDYNIYKIVIGKPLNSDMQETQISLEVEEFIGLIQKRLGTIEIVRVNEFLTSLFTENDLKEKHINTNNLDSAVAKGMLQDYLNEKSK